jgi:hypothetical protein
MAERSVRSRLIGKGSGAMPLKRILGENRNFDQKAIAILLEAYDGLVAELRLRTIEDRESAARAVLQLALGQTDLDATSLRDEAVVLMRGASAGVRCSSLESASPIE